MPDYAALTSLGAGDPIPATEWAKIVANFSVHQSVQALTVTNNTGGTVTRGYVGVLDPAAALSLLATTTIADPRYVVVVTSASIANAATGYAQILGRVSVVNVHGAVALYDPLETYSTAGEAHTGVGRPFAVALEAVAGPGSAQIAVWITPPIGGSMVIVPLTFSLDTSAYAAGDLLADTQVLANAVRVNDGTGVLESVVLNDKDDQGVAMSLVVLSANNSLGTENSAPAITDANADAILGIIDIPSAAWVDLGGTRVATLRDLGLPLVAATGTKSIYVALINGAGAPTFTAAGITARFGIQQA